MKRLICCCIVFFTVVAIHAQKVYFIYLQSETEQPFSVKMGDRVYNSSAPGYLILSKLHDSSYNFSVIFPQNKWPDQQFTVDMRGKDHGYLLKNFGEKGWGLFDLQTLSVLMAVNPSAKVNTEPVEVSAFTDILSRAANDPSLKEKPIAVKQQEQAVTPQAAVVKEQVKEAKVPTDTEKKEPLAIVAEKEKPITEVAKRPDTVVKKTEPVITEKPKEVVEAVAKTDQPVKKEDAPVKPKEDVVIKQDVAKAEPVIKKDDTPVKPKEEAVKTEATKKEEPVVETVAKKEEATIEYKPSTVRRRSESSTTEGFGLTFVDEYADGKKDTIRIIIPPVRSMGVVAKDAKADKKFLDITSDTKDASAEPKPVETGTKKSTVAKCSPADDNDFLKLRKRMAGQNKDDGMISEAAKYFRSKCFSVMQVKNLSTLFLNDASKFRFFDAASGHVTDADNFASLQSELKEQSYIDRFKSIHP